ncbi:hypothetical protein AX774_g4655 [Zancudomyces culisetae]|uniref:Uncharacterized protein n=1 Tax=Zancudomyces culisetae TaxID=1213189 RepID=A0A1R1PLM8_ZANCU|nr:hypothetical protein AX774_g4655 [Zancudomyces culisetae]|eukprot:OMH81881.1 hypothetical protein AX774_g4655 [Zancudomyces culisetae]
MCTGPEQVQSTLPPKKLGIHPITIISIVDHINRARIYKKHDLKFDGINKEYLEERVEHHKKLAYLHASIDHNDINTEGGINNIAKSDVSKYFCAYVLTEDQEGQPPHFESIPLELKSDVAEFVALDEITNSANTEGNENEVVTQSKNSHIFF